MLKIIAYSALAVVAVVVVLAVAFIRQITKNGWNQ